ncbi:MAG: hypothetical protein U9O98_09815 [Asgard group archaeon]|nr:hypothetical protein [Asgard group archaeon]
MTTGAHWDFITTKYSLVDILDSIIVIARFNEKEFLRELIEIRSDILGVETYPDYQEILDGLIAIQDKASDERLLNALSELINQITTQTIGSLEYNHRTDQSESKVSE